MKLSPIVVALVVALVLAGSSFTPAAPQDTALPQGRKGDASPADPVATPDTVTPDTVTPDTVTPETVTPETVTPKEPAVPPERIDPILESGDATETLRALHGSQVAKEQELAELQARLAATADPQEKLELAKSSQTLRDEIRESRLKFESIASGVDVGQFEAPPSRSFDLRTEVENLLEPLVHQLKSVTEAPRVIDQLTTRVESYKQLESSANAAIEKIKTRIAESNGSLGPALNEALAAWTARRDNASREKSVAEYELQQRLLARKDPIEATREFFSQFFSTRGLNLIMAIGAFVITFLFMRVAYRTMFRPLFLRKRRSFPLRLGNVLFHVLTFATAIAAILIVLFAANDWVLMVIVLLFLLGLGWASIRTLPLVLEDMRLLLNLGSVREGERIIFDGLPWRVDALMIYSRLVNPDLTGGMLRIPLRHLIGLHSRPLGPDEAWFPCRQGDWVRLGDGTRGKVDLQTPDMVHLRLPGGGEKIYSTTDFLAQTPQNLSTKFRVQITFGIDYEHQAECTTSIPDIMLARLRKEITKVARPEEVLRLEVEFREAAASSLDYEIQGDFAGSAADRYEPIKRAMARILVEACNEHGWGIPFQQITLHQAS